MWRLWRWISVTALACLTQLGLSNYECMYRAYMYIIYLYVYIHLIGYYLLMHDSYSVRISALYARKIPSAKLKRPYMPFIESNLQGIVVLTQAYTESDIWKTLLYMCVYIYIYTYIYIRMLIST